MRTLWMRSTLAIAIALLAAAWLAAPEALAAIAFANLGASVGQGAEGEVNPDINLATDVTSYSNASWTPPTDGLIIAFVLSARSGGPDTPTMSGNSLTWVQIGTTLAIGSGRGLSLFAANASGATTGATTVSFGANTQLGCIVSFFQATGVDLSGGVAAAFVQSPSNSGTATSGSVTLSAAASSANRPIAAFGHLVNEVSTERANWTEVDDMHGVGFPRGLITQWRSDAFETTASASWTTSADWGGIAAELKAEAAAAASPMTLKGTGLQLKGSALQIKGGT